MREIKLFELLKGISGDEMIEFGDFVKSKVFNSNRNVISLYNFLKKNRRKITEGKISRENIYRSVFRAEKFNELKYWKLTSAFSSVLDKFLTYTEFEKDIFYRKNLLLENYRKRNLLNQFSILSKVFEENSQKEFNKSINFFVNQTHFYFQKISFLNYENNDLLSNDIESAFENLKMFFIMTNLVSVSIISNFDEKFIGFCRSRLWLFNEIISYVDKNRAQIKKNYLSVYIFYLILYTKIYPERESYYKELKKNVLKNTSSFSANFLRHILVNILDYAVKKLTAGNERYLKEIFLINKIMAEKSLTLFGEHILPEYFYSVVEHASVLNEVEWASDFLDKYSNYLNPAIKESVVNLALSKVFFAQKDYDNSLQHLLMVNNINPYFYIAHKILLLQDYYELNNRNAVKSVLAALNKYLKRRIDVEPKLKEDSKKFLFYFKTVFSEPDEQEVRLIIRKLKNENYFTNKKWILSKLNSGADRKNA